MVDIPNSTATTRSLAIGTSLRDSLEVVGDSDWVRVTLTAGETYRFSLDRAGNAGSLDPFLNLRDASGNVIASSDDDGPGLSSQISGFTASTSGTYYLDVGSFQLASAGTYLLSANRAVGGNLPTHSYVQIANFLTNGFWNDNGERERHAFGTRTITYNIDALTSAGQTLAINAFASWTSVTGLTFQRTNGTAQITFDDNQSGAFANYVSSGTTTTSSNVNISTDWLATYGTGINSYSFQTYIHEIGHSLGLGHGGTYNGSAGWNATGSGDNFYLNDSWQATIMSYFDQDQNTSINASRAYVIGPMMADIIAIQDLYGVPTTVNAGATVYGFNSTATGYRSFSEFTQGNMVAFTIFDSGGVDRLDASGFSVAQRIDLRSGQFSDIGGEVGNIGIATNTVIEEAYGGGGADTMIGNAAANVLRGNGGADTMDGGTGNDHLYGGAGADRHVGGDGLDYARYDDANYGNLVINLSNPGANTGAAAGDTYSSIECIVAGAGNDTVVGDAFANRLIGGGGNDIVRAGAGVDYVEGGDGNDHLYGGTGADSIVGGAGLDYARYDEANYGNLVINLSAPGANTGAAAGDTYSGIECIVAGVGNDTVVGDANANRLLGGGGNDIVRGGAGVDYVDGGDGNDHLYGGAGADQHVGGAGLDYARYDEANYGNLTVRLDAPSANTGAAAGDTYSGIECVVLGAGNDTLYGDAVANRLFGMGGNDTIDGRGGSDYLEGGAGADNYRFSTALGASNIDTIAGFQHGVDNIMLHSSIFAGIGPTLTANEFGATSGAGRFIIYQQNTGRLYYDAGGAGVGAGPVQFATVTAGTVLDINDFVMV